MPLTASHAVATIKMAGPANDSIRQLEKRIGYFLESGTERNGSEWNGSDERSAFTDFRDVGLELILPAMADQIFERIGEEVDLFACVIQVT